MGQVLSHSTNPFCRWFSPDVIAAMLVDENKRLLINSFCWSTSNCTLQHCYLCPKRLVANHLYLLLLHFSFAVFTLSCVNFRTGVSLRFGIHLSRCEALEHFLTCYPFLEKYRGCVLQCECPMRR